ncbi:hypothetical protein TrST_g11364 [Triparma strigata]|uniref:RING-type domain-containing protein n=1 Tax=Triparma strigata TaxID=1606541 RepID=A0A9W7EFB0_9STRA|nr:hypothetical protein TrST_g11364 [Triparma strigata]
MSAPVPLQSSVPLKGQENAEEKDKCIICLDSDPNAKIRGCNHSYTCRDCTEELICLGDPCPVCRKPFTRFDVGKWSSGVGERGLWPTSLKNLTQLASGEGFNEYFQDLFVGNEASYLRWKEVFDAVEIHGRRRRSEGRRRKQRRRRMPI